MRFAEGSGFMECLKCGTCCVAPDIKALGKAIGVRCPHLKSSAECAIYAERPAACSNYRPDEICRLVAAPTLAERVNNYLRLFEL